MMERYNSPIFDYSSCYSLLLKKAKLFFNQLNQGVFEHNTKRYLAVAYGTCGKKRKMVGFAIIDWCMDKQSLILRNLATLDLRKVELDKTLMKSIFKHCKKSLDQKKTAITELVTFIQKDHVEFNHRLEGLGFERSESIYKEFWKFALPLA
jgi:hypothetical protein